jgi:HisJ family histidinol phosphate phosphatase
MTERVDNHSHIILADIRDMVAAARANGITEYSITEHVSQFRELRQSIKFGSIHTSGRLFSDLKEYEREFQRIEDRGLGVRVNKGLEVDFSPRFESQVAAFVNSSEWDILLCSVHEFGNANDIERNLAGTSDKNAAQSRWREYFRLQQLALESNLVPFSVLAHPVRLSRGLEKVPADIDELLLELATTAKAKKKALELNGNDVDYAPQLVRMLALACSKAGCSVSIGSDAHHPQEVFRNLGTATDLVDEFKLKQYSPGSKC